MQEDQLSREDLRTILFGRKRLKKRCRQVIADLTDRADTWACDAEPGGSCEKRVASTWESMSADFFYHYNELPRDPVQGLDGLLQRFITGDVYG